MITKEIFDRIQKTYLANADRITDGDILHALTEELGEFSRAVRVENSAAICHNKTVDEPSTTEIIDLMLVATEGFISRGGKFEEMDAVVDRKLTKWEKLWRNTNKENLR